MPSTATQKFLKTLEASNLLSRGQLQQLVRRLERASDDLSANQIAQFLVRKGLITRWQAEMLLGGQSGFYFGRYKLLERLGKGGMGSVFKAEQSGFRRVVALKLMADELLKDKNAVARFHREIQSAAALNHPHIVTAYDADCAGETHFLVMEHVEGVDLGTISKQQPGQLPIGWVCECIRQAAEGLEYAHQQGMIHRDIKPANLLVAHREGSNEPWVKVLDMGLARFVSESGEETALTSTGQVMGTPDYVSPEQAQNARSADIRSDIFSLGCTIFRLLTGQLPFAGENVMEKLTARLTGAALRMRPFRPEIPRDLEAIVGKMLERDPNRRYQTPGEVAVALLPFCALSPDDPVANPADRALGQITVRQRHRSDIDPQFNKFLNQLATEAAEDPDTGTIDKETQAVGEPTFARPTRGSRKMQNWMEERHAADLRRWMWTLAGALALILLVAGAFFWNYSGRTMLIVDLDESAREGVTLKIDGTSVELSSRDRLEFPGTWGKRTISLTRPDYKSISEQLELARGETRVYKPEWRLLPKAARQRQWAALESEVLDAAKNFGDPLPLRDDLLVRQLVLKLEAFRERWKKTPEAAQARDLLARLPLPIDLPERRRIPLPELVAAGDGDPKKAPPELVAVLGDSRFVHGAVIESMAISPDGSLLATTGGDYVRLWDVKTGRAVWSEHGGGSAAIHFTPDGEAFFGWRNKTLRIWQFERGRRRIDNRIDESVRAVDLSLDGKLLALGTDTGVEIRRGLGGEILHKVETERAVRSVAFSPDGRQLAYGGELGMLGMIDPASGEETRSFSGVASNSNSLGWHPDGHLLLSGHYNGQVFLWNPADGTPVRSFKLSAAVSIDGVRFSSSGDSFVVRSGNRLSVWDTQTAQRQRELEGGPFALSADGKTLAVARGGTLVLRDFTTGELKQPIRAHGPLTTAKRLAVSPDGRLLASGHEDGTVSLWDLSTGSELDVLDGGIPEVRAIAFSPDGTKLAVGGRSGLLTLWNLATRRPLWRTKADSWWVLAVAFSPDGTRLATAGHDPNVRLWDVASGRQRNVLYGGDHFTYGLAFSPDGRQLAAGGNGRSVHVWETDGEELIRTIPMPGSVSTIAFNPDGSTLAVGMTSGQMYLLEAANWGGIRRLQDQGRNVRGLAFSADGRLLADVTHDGKVDLWDPAKLKGPPVKTIGLDPYDIRPTDVALTPEGRHVIVASEDAISVYRLEPALGATPVDPGGPLTNPPSLEPSDDQLFATYRRTGNYEKLLPLLDRRVAAGNKAYDYFYRAEALAATGQDERARSDHETASRMAGNTVRGWREAGWWVVGPYPPSLQTEYPPEQNADPTKPVPVVDSDGNPLDETRQWQPVPAADGQFDFVEIFGRRDNVCTYALLRVFSDAEQHVAVLLGSDDGVRLWLNGELVHENDVSRGVRPDEDALLATLQAGRNTFLAKVRNGSGDHGLQLRLSDDPLDMARVDAEENQRLVAPGWLRDELKKAPYDTGLKYRALEIAWNLAAQAGDDPERSRLALELAELAASGDDSSNAADAPWQMLIPDEMSSSGGSTMVLQPDGSVFVTGTLPEADVYTLKCLPSLPNVTAIALETLPDSRLPSGGAGRYSSGNFLVNKLTLSQADGGRSRSLQVRRAMVDSFDRLRGIEFAIDDDADSHWSTYPRQSEPHVAIFQLTEPLQATSKQKLVVEIDSRHETWPSHSLGRFRLWATAATKPLRIADFPAIGRPLHPAAVLALTQLRTGDAPAARKTLERLKTTSSRPTGNAILISALARQTTAGNGQAGQSFKQLEPWLQTDSLPESFTWLLIEAIDDALSADSGNIELLARRADLFLKLGERKQAADDYGQLIKLDPNNRKWSERLAQADENVIAAWNFERGVDGWRENANCRISQSAGVLHVQSSEAGKSPLIRTEVAAPAGWKQIIIRARHTGGMDAVLHAIHRRGPDRISDVAVGFKPLPPADDGWTKYHLFFYASGDIRQLRLRPNWTGDIEFDVDSIVLKNSSLEEALLARSALVEAHPDSIEPLRLQAELLGRIGRWQEAAEELSKVVKLRPGDHWQSFHAAALFRQTGDVARYQDHCRDMLARWGDGTVNDPVVVERTVKACALGVLSRAERRQMSKLREWLMSEGIRSLREDERRWLEPWLHLSAGMASYRDGDFAWADELLKQGRDLATGGLRYMNVTAMMFQAMAQHQLKQPQTALQIYRDAAAVFDSELPLLDGGDLGAVWFDWLVAQIARREAEETLGIQQDEQSLSGVSSSS